MALTYSGSTAFRRELEARVATYFDGAGHSRHATRRMYVKTLFLLFWLGASYAGLVWGARTWWQAIPLAVSVALAMAGIGFNIQHDGNHGAYSHHRVLNKAAALSLNLLGGDAYFWHYKHNIAHHTYPNISGADNDIYMGPFARMSPHDPRYWFHRFQYLYVWALYALLAVKWQLVDDFRSMIRPGVADTSVPRPRGWNQVCFWSGKTCFLMLAFGVPLLTGHRLGAVVGLYFLTMAVLGLTLATVFQLAHCVEEAEFRVPADGSRRIEREWMAHQIETAVDFARDNRLLTWYLGGLNFQIEHHLFPKICHVHYPALSPIVEATCRAHGIRHTSHRTMRRAVRSHVRWLRHLGRAGSVEPARAQAAPPACASALSASPR
ncbi:MAG TPA: acyl-CoA desaturase [Polyangia bacterium]|jgi:linoleoyl-CoA desaturase|nr:acyl-CoA desaturase [Polyangia bacterium]